jgi:hypothetical protein
MKPILLLATALAAVGLPPAVAQTLYKYVSPNGPVAYLQTPVPGARLVAEAAAHVEHARATIQALR